jgi:hypothetical protein
VLTTTVNPLVTTWATIRKGPLTSGKIGTDMSASRTFPEVSQVLRADDGKPEVSSSRLNSGSSVLCGLEGSGLEKKSSKIVL